MQHPSVLLLGEDLFTLLWLEWGCFKQRTGRNADIQLFMGRVVSGSALGANLSRTFTSSQGHLR